MRILVVCGAGASSTFVAQRVRRAAEAAGRDLTIAVGTEQLLPSEMDAADVVLVGPSLYRAVDRIRRTAAGHAVAVVLLPSDIFTDLDGARTLALIESAQSAEPPVTLPPAPERNSA